MFFLIDVTNLFKTTSAMLARSTNGVGSVGLLFVLHFLACLGTPQWTNKMFPDDRNTIENDVFDWPQPIDVASPLTETNTISSQDKSIVDQHLDSIRAAMLKSVGFGEWRVGEMNNLPKANLSNDVNKVDDASADVPTTAATAYQHVCEQDTNNETMTCRSISSENMGVFEQALYDASAFYGSFSLILTDGDLSEAPADVFADTTITSLDLDGKRGQLPWPVLKSVGKDLRILTLTKHNVTRFEVPIDIDLPFVGTLKSFNISRNLIKELKVGTFKKLLELTVLVVSDNSIFNIAAKTFAGLSKLEKLILDNMYLRTIEVNAFEGLSSLTTLNLQNNDITTIPDGGFQGLAVIKVIYLADNPFICFPELEWLKSWLKQIKFDSGATCVHPPPVGPLVGFDFSQ